MPTGVCIQRAKDDVANVSGLLLPSLAARCARNLAKSSTSACFSSGNCSKVNNSSAYPMSFSSIKERVVKYPASEFSPEGAVLEGGEEGIEVSQGGAVVGFEGFDGLNLGS